MIVDNESAYFNESNRQNGQRLYDVTMSNQDYFNPGNQVQDQEFPLQSNQAYSNFEKQDETPTDFTPPAGDAAKSDSK